MAWNVVSIVTRRAWMARVHPRHEADVLGNLSNGRETLDCLVEDVSFGGARVWTAEQLSVGERLQLSIATFGFSAPVTVVWSSPDGAGLAFEVQHRSLAGLKQI
jgi:hypothetical protein